MKKIFATLMFAGAALVSYAQKPDLVPYPHVVMESGTIVDVTFNQRTQQVVLDINGNESNESLIVTIEKDGIVYDVQETVMENDRIILNTDLELDGKCKVIVRQRLEQVEVAETEDADEEE